MPLLCRVPWAPCNGTTSTPPKLVVTLAPSNGTTSPTIAHYNGTQQWHHVHSPKVGRLTHYNGTLRWHPAMAPRPLHPAMAPWCHVQSAKVVRRPPPLLEVSTPIAISIWGKEGNGVLQPPKDLKLLTYLHVMIQYYSELSYSLPLQLQLSFFSRPCHGRTACGERRWP